jgi:hypothetical protein
MNGVNEVALFAGVFLIVGVLCFYLYTRINYTEKKISLIENMLLDIKSELDRLHKEEPEYAPEPEGAPLPLETKEVENLPEDDGIYTSVLEQVHATSSEEDGLEQINEIEAVSATKVTANYESMTKAELTALCKQRSIKTSARPGRAELIAALRKADESAAGAAPSGVSSTSEIFPLAGSLDDKSGFHVEMGDETSE